MKPQQLLQKIEFPTKNLIALRRHLQKEKRKVNYQLLGWKLG